MEDRSSEPLKTTKLLFIVLVMGPILFLAITLYLYRTQLIFDTSELHVFMLVLLALIVVEVPLLSVIHKPMIAAAQKAESVQKQGELYQTICLVRWAMIEGVCLFAIVSLMVTHNLIFLIPFAILFVVFLMLYPSQERFEAMLGKSTYAKTY